MPVSVNLAILRPGSAAVQYAAANRCSGKDRLHEPLRRRHIRRSGLLSVYSSSRRRCQAVALRGSPDLGIGNRSVEKARHTSPILIDSWIIAKQFEDFEQGLPARVVLKAAILAHELEQQVHGGVVVLADDFP